VGEKAENGKLKAEKKGVRECGGCGGVGASVPLSIRQFLDSRSDPDNLAQEKAEKLKC
jgi:hypothetical protein